jgi:predicted tellurium resistance membrane protein TerC
MDASFLTTEHLTALLTLTAMEVVLGIDNVVFISILVGRLPAEKREKIRKLGLSMALLMRLGLLFSISWLMGLTAPLFTLLSHEFSGRDLVLLGGGLFLIAKATFEIHHKLEEVPDKQKMETIAKIPNASLILAQVLVLDIVFSLDSVITAVGMVQQVWIMVAAMLISMLVMLVAARSVGDFVDKHPTVKILALSFLILIGVMLVADGLGHHVPKGYVYFAMAFSLTVELLNMRYRKRQSIAH